MALVLAANVLTAFNAIPNLNGLAQVYGPTGGPFTIIFSNPAAASNLLMGANIPLLTADFLPTNTATPAIATIPAITATSPPSTSSCARIARRCRRWPGSRT